ncbi:MAG: hypothetical protein AAF392_02435 [Bacteroidota bacterium]
MALRKTLLILSLALIGIISNNCTSPVYPYKQEGGIVKAITSGNLEHVKRLMVQSQIDANNPLEIYMGNRQGSYTPLHLVAMYGHAHVLVYSLDEKAATEAKTAGSGQTATSLKGIFAINAIRYPSFI